MFFFFNDTATTEIYTLSLHDALPISARRADGAQDRSRELRRDARARGSGREGVAGAVRRVRPAPRREAARARPLDRKSTRLNSSHANISYAVFCLKKKTTTHPYDSSS